MEAGDTIGGYRIVRLLGKGGMAEVYEVEHTALGVRRAMKVFRAGGEREALMRTRFLAEGRILARLDHPRVVRVYDCAVDQGSGAPYIVMDLVLGADGAPHTLSSLHREMKTAEEQVLAWYGDLAEALAYVHSAGVVHRDIKPSNILVGADGHAVLSDFGVSRISDEALRRELAMEATMITDANAASRFVFGTASYLAPEIRDGSIATAASDIYALGVSLFRLLTGVWYEPDSDALSLLAGYDPVWRGIFPALLAKDPKDRRLPVPRRSAKRRLAWTLAAVAAALAVAAAAWLLRPPGDEPEPPSAPSGDRELPQAGYERLPYVATPEDVTDVYSVSVDTGYTPLLTDRVETKIRLGSFDANQGIFSARETAATNTFTCMLSNARGNRRLRFDHGVTPRYVFHQAKGASRFTEYAEDEDYEIVMDGNTLGFSVNGVESSTALAANPPDPNATPGMTFRLFVVATKGSGATLPAKGCRMYYFRVYDRGGALKLDLVPARQTSNGRVGFYDRVGNSFKAARALVCEAEGQE